MGTPNGHIGAPSARALEARVARAIELCGSGPLEDEALSQALPSRVRRCRTAAFGSVDNRARYGSYRRDAMRWCLDRSRDTSSKSADERDVNAAQRSLTLDVDTAYFYLCLRTPDREELCARLRYDSADGTSGVRCDCHEGWAADSGVELHCSTTSTGLDST
jgi:hypothetical protein